MRNASTHTSLLLPILDFSFTKVKGRSATLRSDLVTITGAGFVCGTTPVQIKDQATRSTYRIAMVLRLNLLLLAIVVSGNREPRL